MAVFHLFSRNLYEAIGRGMFVSGGCTRPNTSEPGSSRSTSFSEIKASLIFLATMTGLRIGEILALRWGRIDLLRGTLKGHFGSPKTRASRREVPLAAAVVRELKSLYSRSTENPQEALVFF